MALPLWSRTFDLTIASRKGAGILLSERIQASLHWRWLVSISVPGREPVLNWNRLDPDRRIHLEFDDIDRDGHAWYVPPGESDVRQLLDFGERIDGGRILVHCAAGISRSAASAYALLCQKMPRGTEAEALDHIYRIRTRAQPNKRLVEWADRLLDREGTMIAALQDRPKGPEARG